MKKGQLPTNLDPTWWKANMTKGFKEDPKLQVNLLFAYNHYKHYPTLNINSKDDKVMYDRVNMIRQLSTGIKKSRDSVKASIKNAKGSAQDPDKAALQHYLELLKRAEDDRQNWIKIERGVGNTKHLDEFVIGPGLDERITF